MTLLPDMHINFFFIYFRKEVPFDNGMESGKSEKVFLIYIDHLALDIMCL